MVALPSDKQVGGDHYKGMVIQLSEFIHKNGIGWMEGNAIKYIVRHSRKHGADDIDKAIHYLEMLKEWKYAEEAPVSQPSFHHPDCNYWKWDWRYSWSSSDCNCDAVAGPEAPPAHEVAFDEAWSDPDVLRALRPHEEVDAYIGRLNTGWDKTGL